MNRSFTLSHHAIDRALDMSVDGDEIARAVEHGDVRPGKNGCELRGAGRIVVVYAPDARLVVTILWRYANTRRSDVNRAESYGRDAEHPEHTSSHRARKRAHKQRHPKHLEGGRANGRGRRARRWLADVDDD